MKQPPSLALAFLLTAGAVFGPAGDGPAAAKQELKRLEGTWEQTSAEYKSKKIDFPVGGRPRLIIQGERFTREAGGKASAAGTLRVDPGKNPRAIDLIESGKLDVNRPGLGIYELNGDELRMCVAVPGQPRPTAFSAEEGNRQAIITLRRVKPKA
jgi:uncharacterized protein (TIGR03067 family)